MIRNVPARKGFTLLELLVVVGILAALVALALPYYQDYVNQSKLTAAAADLTTFKKALAMYDQLEPRMFTTNATYDDFTPLIGKYVQDFRKTSGQTAPTDPWSNDYHVMPIAGSIVCGGPDGIIETPIANRIASSDDILVTWKPQFFVSSAKKINITTIELTFTRKINTPPDDAVTTAGVAVTSNAAQKISDTIYRFKFATTINAATSISVTGTITAQDGATLSSTDTKPGSTDTCNYSAIN